MPGERFAQWLWQPWQSCCVLRSCCVDSILQVSERSEAVERLQQQLNALKQKTFKLSRLKKGERQGERFAQWLWQPWQSCCVLRSCSATVDSILQVNLCFSFEESYLLFSFPIVSYIIYRPSFCSRRKLVRAI